MSPKRTKRTKGDRRSFKKHFPGNQDVEQLRELQMKIFDAVEEIKQIMDKQPVNIADEANNYWIAHILCALSDDNDYLGGSMVTMDDTLRKITNE